MYQKITCIALLKKQCMIFFDSDTAGECLRSPSCGAKYPGILDTSHPKDLETGKEVKGTICFAKSDKCCYKKKTITIRRCRGFWIYELPRASPKGARYCGNNKGN